jgi:hypothetical protein
MLEVDVIDFVTTGQLAVLKSDALKWMFGQRHVGFSKSFLPHVTACVYRQAFSHQCQPLGQLPFFI